MAIIQWNYYAVSSNMASWEIHKKCVFFEFSIAIFDYRSAIILTTPKKVDYKKKTIAYVSKYHYNHECMYCQKNKEKCVPFLEGFYISRDGSDDPVIYHDSFFLTAWIVWNLANHKGELCQQITCDIMAKPSAGLL